MPSFCAAETWAQGPYPAQRVLPSSHAAIELTRLSLRLSLCFGFAVGSPVGLPVILGCLKLIRLSMRLS